MSPFIICPWGRASDLQRIQIDLANWPGLTTSGIDTHLAARTDAELGQFSASWDATYALGYDTKELLLEGADLTLYAERDAAGYLNFAHPIAVPLPRWKSRWSASYNWDTYTLADYVSYISSYEDLGGNTTTLVIDPFLT